MAFGVDGATLLEESSGRAKRARQVFLVEIYVKKATTIAVLFAMSYTAMADVVTMDDLQVPMDDLIDRIVKDEHYYIVLHGFRVHTEHWDGNFSQENIEWMTQSLDGIERQLQLAVGVLPKHAINLLRISTVFILRDTCSSRRTGSVRYFSFEKGGYVLYDCFEYWAKPLSFQNRNLAIHELAHAWHDQHIPDGFRNQYIMDAFQHALTCDWHGREDYWMTNEREYFAEMTVAYYYHDVTPPYIWRFMDEDTKNIIPKAWSKDREELAEPIEFHSCDRLTPSIDE